MHRSLLGSVVFRQHNRIVAKHDFGNRQLSFGYSYIVDKHLIFVHPIIEGRKLLDNLVL